MNLMSEIANNMLRAVSGSLQTPTIVILLVILAATVLMFGTFIAEFFTERLRMRVKIPSLIDDIQGKNRDEIWNEISKSGLLKRHKKILKEIIDRWELSENTRVALCKRLLFEESSRYSKITRITDLIAKIAPMFGLMGTLIPLAPGLIALGQGDTKSLSDSLLIAFDTTVAGLISAAAALLISSIRKRWYNNYETALETIMECVLECQGGEAKCREDSAAEDLAVGVKKAIKKVSIHSQV
jgi:biopolymer transport protein ExbB/TolQ